MEGGEKVKRGSERAGISSWPNLAGRSSDNLTGWSSDARRVGSNPRITVPFSGQNLGISTFLGRILRIHSVET
jgi:hypothetical protein